MFCFSSCSATGFHLGEPKNKQPWLGKQLEKELALPRGQELFQKQRPLGMKEAYAFLEGAHIRDGHIPDCAQFKVLTQEANMWGTFFRCVSSKIMKQMF